MLTVLRIKNLAIVTELEIEFSLGMNVLTGETGGGKSIVLQALALLTGKRASVEIIRHGQDKCEVEGLFSLSSREIGLCAELWPDGGLVEDDHCEVLIRRIVDKGGRGRVYVNGSLVTLSMLQRLGVVLVDITGQHQQQSLLEPGEHMLLLDGYGVPVDLLERVRVDYIQYAEAKRKLEIYLHDAGERSEYLRRISLEKDELDLASLRSGERAELDAELGRLSSVESLGVTATECLGLLQDNDNAVEDQLGHLRGLIQDAVKIDKGLQEVFELVDSAYQQTKEAHYFLTDYLSGLEADPNRLESLRERIAEIARLERKYGRDESEIVEYWQAISNEHAQWEAGQFDESKLRKDLDSLLEVLIQSQDELSACRRDVAQRLEGLVQKELRTLGMKKARFEVRIAESVRSASGVDRVEFFMSANPGQPLRPLSKVASGGELSRVLLTLKTLLSDRNARGLQVFDEIDTGIGGEVAVSVGEKLRRVSEKAQVLLVTHSPQIAAMGHQHFSVVKTSSDSSTYVEIKKLAQEERVKEIARMLSGKRVSERFHESAKELLSVC